LCPFFSPKSKSHGTNELITGQGKYRPDNYHSVAVFLRHHVVCIPVYNVLAVPGGEFFVAIITPVGKTGVFLDILK